MKRYAVTYDLRKNGLIMPVTEVFFAESARLACHEIRRRYWDTINRKMQINEWTEAKARSVTREPINIKAKEA